LQVLPDGGFTLSSSLFTAGAAARTGATDGAPENDWLTLPMRAEKSCAAASSDSNSSLFAAYKLIRVPSGDLKFTWNFVDSGAAIIYLQSS
jgi:hypothetical protein